MASSTWSSTSPPSALAAGSHRGGGSRKPPGQSSLCPRNRSGANAGLSSSSRPRLANGTLRLSRTPRMRLDLRSTAPWHEDVVEAALDRLLGRRHRVGALHREEQAPGPAADPPVATT